MLDPIRKGYRLCKGLFLSSMLSMDHYFYFYFFFSRLLNLLYCNRQSKSGLLFPAGAAPLHRGVQKALGHGTEQCVLLRDYSSPILHFLNN